MRRIIKGMIVGLTLVSTVSPAWAYLDPGTGSVILQGILGGIAAASVVGKMYWYKLKAFFTGKSHTDSDHKSTEESAKTDHSVPR